MVAGCSGLLLPMRGAGITITRNDWCAAHAWSTLQCGRCADLHRDLRKGEGRLGAVDKWS